MSLKAGRVGVNPSQVDPVDGSLLVPAVSIRDNEVTVVKGTEDANNPIFLRVDDNVCMLFFRLKGVTADAYETLLTIPNKYRPPHNVFFPGRIAGGGGDTYFQLGITQSGGPVAVQCADALSNKEIYNYLLTWII